MSQLAEIQAPKLSVEELETNKADLYILYFFWAYSCPLLENSSAAAIPAKK